MTTNLQASDVKDLTPEEIEQANKLTLRTRKTPVPRNAESITAGALKLTLSEKVELVKALKADIATEVKEANEKAKSAETLVNGL